MRWLWMACADNRTGWVDDVMMRSCSVLRSGSMLRMYVVDNRMVPGAAGSILDGWIAKNGSRGCLNTSRLQETKS
jgi:hypothetical protein